MKAASKRNMSLLLLAPTTGWNQRSASAPEAARSQYGCTVGASA